MIDRLVEEALGEPIASAVPLSGGDVAAAYAVTMADGNRVFAKTKHDAAPDFFPTEAAGLAWLREANAISVPEVLAVSDDPPLLVLEWIDIGHRGVGDSDFGTQLAALHRSGADQFGRSDGCTTGSRRLPNEARSTWAEFYATQRLEPLIRLAASVLPQPHLNALADVVDRIDDLVGPEEPPARLHGDLWAGNRLVDVAGQNWLIDPACFGGHREFDLSMMLLFGGFGSDAFAAYHDAYPLEPGWQDRVPLHQLAPLVVHAIKFGGHYVEGVGAALTRL